MTIISGDIPDGKTGPESLAEIIARHPILRPTTPTQYAILLGDMPGQSVPPVVRLRSALKSFRRAYHLVCIGIIDASGEVVQCPSVPTGRTESATLVPAA